MFDRFIVLGLILFPLVAAYVFYLILFYIFGKIWNRNECAKDVLKAIRKPSLFLFLEIAGIVSVLIASIPLHYEKIAIHVLLIAILATLGWLAGACVRALYRYVRKLHQTDTLADFSKRSFLTQSQILYRAVMFVICVLTAAAISMTFPNIKNFGIGILGSAGVAGLALGLAAKPILQNLIAGFQIAFTRMLKMGDAVLVEGEYGFVEQIFLTHVIVQTWDLRRMVLPISHFIEKPFINYSSHSTELLGIAFISCDYQAPLDMIRTKFSEILASTPLWSKITSKVEVFELTHEAMRLRLLMSARNPSDASDLQSYVREKMIEFLQKEHPEALPKMRYLVREEQ